MSNILSITYDDAIAITASDSVDDPSGPFAAFHTGTGGTIKVTTIKGNSVALTNLPAGIVYTLAIKRVWSSTTTATGVFGMVALPFKKAASS
jgi:hypothetical protein